MNEQPPMQIPCKQCPVLPMCITKGEIFCDILWNFLDNYNGSVIGTEVWDWLENRFVSSTENIEVLIHCSNFTCGPYRLTDGNYKLSF